MATPTVSPSRPITVIDSIMGSGKTTFILDYINKANVEDLATRFTDNPQRRRFLYVAPLLSEVDRVIKACPDLRFKDPQPVEGRKFYHLKSLIEAGENVCTTHALFSMLSREIYDLLKAQNYTLIIDEVITCVDMLKTLSKSDRALLFGHGMVYIELGTDRLRWNNERYPDYRGRFDEIKGLCNNGNLVVFRPKRKNGSEIDTSKEPIVLIWEFPSDFLRCFDAVFVLTYLFHGSPMMSYLRAEGVDFEMKAVEGGRLIEWENVDEAEIKAKLRSLVSIYEGPMNAIGAKQGKGNPLSSSWFDKAPAETRQRLRNSSVRFFEHIARTPSKANAWTTFNKARRELAGKGYARGFIPVNAKATNDYIDKQSLAYLCNIFHQPVIRGFFEDKGIPVHEDVHALSEMIQWIWRSQVRRGDPVTVYVPSDRMRSLLKEWLNSRDVASLIKAAA